MTLYMSVQKVPRFAASRDTQSPSTSSPAGNNIPLKQPVVGGHNTSLEQPVLVDQQASLEHHIASDNVVSDWVQNTCSEMKVLHVFPESTCTP